MNPQSFINKWRNVTVKEKGSYVSHFNDLCALIGHQAPLDMDPDGYFFGFEVKTDKSSGGQGFADVWYKDHFAWEYKSKYADLDNAYQQLLFYHDALDNPPLLIVSDGKTIIIRTKITNSPKKEYVLTLDDLLQPEKLAVLRAAFQNPLSLRAEQTTEEVTEEAAREFSRIAQLLYQYGNEPQSVAHFLIKILFCLFSEDVGLLPEKLFTRILQNSRTNSKAFSTQLQQLFQSMTTGGWFGADPIRHINGHLFDDVQVLDLDSDSLDILWRVSGLDWSQIKPSIFGTLFERSLDPTKRSQLGAHYTSEEDILLIVEPVLIAPLQQQWKEVHVQAQKLATARDAAKNKQSKNKAERKMRDLLMGFAQDLAEIRILDAACGSGNFLYVALRQLLNLWKEVSVLAAELNLGYMAPLKDFSPHPSQLFGIEINEYAYQLAQATIWIGYIQWFVENGYAFPPEPIISKLDNIERRDAILTFDENGNPVEPVWPVSDVIIGNPPFLGDKKMKAELGYDYVKTLRNLYRGRVPGGADLVTYWFEKARALIETRRVKRVGLLATQGIRGGKNRKVLERIKQTGEIFWAISDRDWILDGANVHVSMIGFDDGNEKELYLDGERVSVINSNLTGLADTTQAKSLQENANLAFIGTQKGGKFEIPEALAKELIAESGNPHGKPNSDVVKPWINGLDIARGPQRKWIIDLGVETTEREAALYEKPFEYVKKNVKEKRERIRSENLSTTRWWLFQRPRPEMRKALIGLPRYIATPRVAKHRLFSWIEIGTIPDSAVVAIARSDDYFFGVLHSKLHEIWARRTGTQVREAESGFRYTPTTTFETFPSPWPPGQEAQNDPRVQEIADAARELVNLRDEWLNPPEASESELKKRTLTNLYNLRPTWLELAHKKLDKAVFNAYGWPDDLTDNEILERLLVLNLARYEMSTTY